MLDTQLQRFISTQVYLSTKVMALLITCLPSRHPLVSSEELEDDRRRKYSRSSWSSKFLEKQLGHKQQLEEGF